MRARAASWTSLALVLSLAGGVAGGLGGASGTAVAQGAGPGDEQVVTVPVAIDTTGTDDVTDALNGFLAGVEPGTTVEFPEGGRFRVEGTMLLDERRNVTIEGNGSTIFATTPGGITRAHVAVTGGSGITIRKLIVDGANPAAGVEDGAYQPDFEGQHGFSIKGTDGVELDQVAVTDVYGDFIYLGRTDDGRWTRRAWIHDSLLSRSGRQGIAIVAGQDVVIERNGISEVARSTIDLEPNARSGGAINIHVIDNEIGTGRLLFLAVAGNGPVDQVIVSNNRLTGKLLTVTILPPPGDRRTNFWITGNRGGAASSRTPIKVNRVDGLVVWRNSQPVRRGEVGVRTDDVCGLTVEANDFGPFAEPVSPQGPACGTVLGPVPPEPADVFNRAATDEPDPTVPSDEPTTTVDEPVEAPAPDAPVEGSDDSNESWTGTIAVGILAAMSVLAALITSARARTTRRHLAAQRAALAQPDPDSAAGDAGAG